MKTEQEQTKQMLKTLCDKFQCSAIDRSYMAKSCRQCEDIIEALHEAGYGDISEYKAEIERLKAENEKLLDSIESVQAGRCRLRCPLTEQAVKEFAEKLKKYSYTDNCFADGKWHRYVLVSDIDELIGGKEK